MQRGGVVTDLDFEIEGTALGIPDEADKLSIRNNPETDALWEGVVAEAIAEGTLAQQRDTGNWRALGGIARLFVGVTAGSNDPALAWWRFLDGKGVRRGKRRGKHLLFYALIEHLSNEYASQDETRSKSIISRRAAVLQHWHDQERDKVPADQVAEWIATNGGVNALAAIANPPKPPMTKDERKAARADREACLHQLVVRDPLTSMNLDVLPDNLRPFADGTYRLALIRVLETAVDIIAMADDGPVSQKWLNKNAPGIVERLTAASGECEPAEDGDAASLMSEFDSVTVH
jgi:hypothetical protein